MKVEKELMGKGTLCRQVLPGQSRWCCWAWCKAGTTAGVSLWSSPLLFTKNFWDWARVMDKRSVAKTVYYGKLTKSHSWEEWKPMASTVRNSVLDRKW